jgi:hypothetical protein
MCGRHGGSETGFFPSQKSSIWLLAASRVNLFGAMNLHYWEDSRSEHFSEIRPDTCTRDVPDAGAPGQSNWRAEKQQFAHSNSSISALYGMQVRDFRTHHPLTQ